jgi:hypothetical protein
MRRFFVASSVLALAMIGYAVATSSAQSTAAGPIALGDRVRLWYPDSGSGVTCVVTSVSDDFVRCASAQGDPFMPIQVRDEWFNLRTLRSFERLPNDR